MHVSSSTWKVDPKIYTQKQACSYTKSDVAYVSSSGTALWNLGKEGNTKRMIEHQYYRIPQDVKVEDIRMCTESC
jgi:hypothetical protein